ncbi:MAG TPA: SIMPL domain-containing protein [Pyrinomonadaceae bacterium]|nr:SIMPL domain-containing protein [Pyrinomonadaceae bacterium]
MKRSLLTMTGVFALVLLFTAQAFAGEITVRGKLAHTVEAGGWLILTDSQKYLVINARRFQNESWFHEGATVEAMGETRSDVVTTQMEGTPFEARVMRPFAEGVPGSVAVAGEAPRRLTRVLVTGDSIVQAQPDTAILSISVVTQNKRALDAQSENANKSDAVVRAIKLAAGAGAEVKTSGYVLEPQRLYRENQPPTITGYEARNSVTVTLSDLTKVGAVIDAASQAGANNVDNVSFTLRKDRPAKSQALTEATREALDKAQAIAGALGGRVVRIAEVQEANAVVRPISEAFDKIQTMRSAVAQAPTPIEVGTLDIHSQVQLIAEVDTGQ